MLKNQGNICDTIGVKVKQRDFEYGLRAVFRLHSRSMIKASRITYLQAGGYWPFQANDQVLKQQWNTLKKLSY